MRSKWVLKVVVILLLTPTLAWAESKWGFIVNWTSQKMLVMIVPENTADHEASVFKLEAVESMGKGNYSYHPPNVVKFRLEEGNYTVFFRYVSSSEWNRGDISINGAMHLPFEIDIEE